jgi:hypothetical protein
VPAPAYGTAVRLAPTLHPGEQRGIERIALGTVPALARAHALAFLAGGFFHNAAIEKLRTQIVNQVSLRTARMGLCSMAKGKGRD